MLNSVQALATATTNPIRVTYSDTDRMGYAYYARYLVWFEIGRTDLLRRLGKSYRDWEDQDGVYLPVKSCEIQYCCPARYDDEIEIVSRIIKLTRASITISYEVLRKADQVVLARGSTVHPFIDKDGNIVKAGDKMLPDIYARQLASDRN